MLSKLDCNSSIIVKSDLHNKIQHRLNLRYVNFCVRKGYMFRKGKKHVNVKMHAKNSLYVFVYAYDCDRLNKNITTKIACLLAEKVSSFSSPLLNGVHDLINASIFLKKKQFPELTEDRCVTESNYTELMKISFFYVRKSQNLTN